MTVEASCTQRAGGKKRNRRETRQEGYFQCRRSLDDIPYLLAILALHGETRYTKCWVRVLFCTVLYCSVLYCTVLYCTVLYCTVLYCTVLYCTILCCIVLYCTVLYCTALYCTVLYCTVLYSTVRYRTIMCCILFYRILLLSFMRNHLNNRTTKTRQKRNIFYQCKTTSSCFTKIPFLLFLNRMD